MLALKTSSFDNPWLPSLDLHAEGGELVLHADLRALDGEVEISIDGGDLILDIAAGRDEPVHHGRLPLPFPVCSRPAVRRSSPEILEIRIPIPDERRAS
jgi:hypothetical protein